MESMALILRVTWWLWGSCEKLAKQQVRPRAGTLTLDSPQLGRAGGTPATPEVSLTLPLRSSKIAVNGF